MNDSLCHLKKIALLTETIGPGFRVGWEFFSLFVGFSCLNV